jgi:hypothetical protein
MANAVAGGCAGQEAFYSVTNPTSAFHNFTLSTTAGALASGGSGCTPSTFFSSCWASGSLFSTLPPFTTYYFVVTGTCVSFTVTFTLM